MIKSQKVFFSLTFCMLLLTLTGCQPKMVTPEVNTYHEIIEPPADGWTDADIESVLFINGKQISFPFTLDELGEEFTWDLEYAFFYADSDRESSVPIDYCGENFAIGSIDARNANELNSAKVVGISYSSYPSAEESTNSMPNLLHFNGITLKSDLEEVQQAFGKDEAQSFYIRSESYFIYCHVNEECGVSHIMVAKDDFKDQQESE